MKFNDNEPDEARRAASAFRAKQEAEEGFSKGRDRSSDTVPFAESQHPAIRAEELHELQPKTRQYGHSVSGRRNDAVAYEHLARLRRLTGLKPMSRATAVAILEGGETDALRGPVETFRTGFDRAAGHD